MLRSSLTSSKEASTEADQSPSLTTAKHIAPKGRRQTAPKPRRRPGVVWQTTTALLPRLADLPEESDARKRAMLIALCRSVDGDDATVRLKAIDQQTGALRLMSESRVERSDIEQAGIHSLEEANRTSSLPVGSRKGNRLSTRKESAGPALEDTLCLARLQLVACLEIRRRPGRSAFTAAERATVEQLHRQCLLAYAGDLRQMK